MVGIIAGLTAMLGLLLTLAYVVLVNTAAFTITSIDAEATEHVSAESIARLAAIPEGTTLLNVNEDHIREGLRKNPWIAAVDIIREFPDRLKIVVTERSVRALVMVGADGVVWRLGDDYVWIEPLDLATTSGGDVASVALAEASQAGAILITDLPVGVSPLASYPATDAELDAVRTFCNQLSDSFLSQVVSVSAPSPEAISCVLENGVEVSLGAPSSIVTKEVLVAQLLERYPNRLTYINVRIPSSPSYRLIDAASVQGGTGATAEMGEDGQGFGASGMADATTTAPDREGADFEDADADHYDTYGSYEDDDYYDDRGE